MQNREFALTEQPFTRESPLVVHVGEKFMIEARLVNKPNAQPSNEITTVKFDQLHLAVLEFDSDCAIRVLHPLPGAEAQPLRPLGRVCIGALNGPGKFSKMVHILVLCFQVLYCMAWLTVQVHYCNKPHQ